MNKTIHADAVRKVAKQFAKGDILALKKRVSALEEKVKALGKEIKGIPSNPVSTGKQILR